MKDSTLRGSDDTGVASGSEHLMARFGSRDEAEAAARRLQEIGVAPAGIALKEGKAALTARPKAHIGEGLLLGISVGGLLGALSGAIFASPTQQIMFAGQTFVGEAAGALGGLGVGLLLGILLGIVVGLISKATATSPVAQFDEMNADTALLEVSVPGTLAARAREILNRA